MTRTPMLSYKKTLTITILAVLMVAIACFVHVQTAWGEPAEAATPTQAVVIEAARTAKVPAAIPVPLDSTTTGNGFLVPMATNSNAQTVSVPNPDAIVSQMSNGTWLAALTLLSVIAIGSAFGGIMALRAWKRTQQPVPVTDTE